MANVQPEKLLNTERAAEILGLRPVTLEQWRYRRVGPAFRRHGRRIFYTEAELLRWSSAQRVDPSRRSEGAA